MGYNSDRHHRRSQRLPGWNYATGGLYFLTICTQHRECLFGEIVDGQMVMSAFGQIVAAEWERSQQIRQEIEFDAWVLMPNHLHAIVCITELPDSAELLTADPNENCDRPMMRPKSISSLIAGFKAITTARINTMRQSPGVKVWQRNYYDSVIRNERGRDRLRDYIENNPRQWEIDQLHPNIPSKW
jgi:REP element-mobilizing transposase RayT